MTLAKYPRSPEDFRQQPDQGLDEEGEQGQKQHRPATTAMSSVIEAVQFENGPGKVLMSARPRRCQR